MQPACDRLWSRVIDEKTKISLLQMYCLGRECHAYPSLLEFPLDFVINFLLGVHVCQIFAILDIEYYFKNQAKVTKCLEVHPVQVCIFNFLEYPPNNCIDFLKLLKEINAIVGRIFKKVKNADLDRVHFKAFGDFSLIF